MYNSVCSDFSEINESIGLNKGVQEGFFSHLSRSKSGFDRKISKINKHEGLNNKGV